MATIADIDLEAGDTSEFSGTELDTGNTFAAAVAAVKNGTYGLNVVGAGTNPDASGNVDLGVGSTKAQVWTTFWLRLVGNVGVGNPVGVCMLSDSLTGS